MNLSEQPDRSLRMSDLANVASLSVSVLTRLVDRLDRQGLVRRTRCETDGRGQFAVLTPQGLARLKKAYRPHLAGVREHVMSHLGDLDLAAFAAAVADIADEWIGPPVWRTSSR